MNGNSKGVCTVTRFKGKDGEVRGEVDGEVRECCNEKKKTVKTIGEVTGKKAKRDDK